MLKRAMLPLLLSSLNAACATDYARGRAADASQVLHVGVGASKRPALWARIRTPAPSIVVGSGESRYWGNDFGYASRWKAGGMGFGVFGIYGHSKPGKLTNSEKSYLSSMAVPLLTFSEDHRFCQSVISGFGAVEVGVHAGWLGFSFGANAIEMLDFVSGIVGMDLLQDDQYNLNLDPLLGSVERLKTASELCHRGRNPLH